MAIMTRCCCWDVRGGSIASGIYTLSSVILALFYFIYQFVIVGKTNAEVVPLDNNEQSGASSVAAMSGIGFLLYIFTIVACILLFFGINRDKKWMLIPFMIAKTLQLLLAFVSFIVFIFAIIMALPTIDVSLILYLIFLIPFIIIDVLCLLCVVSLYQCYVEGVVFDKW